MTSKCLLLQRGTLLDIAQYETEGIATNDLTTWILHRWIATTSITAMHWTWPQQGAEACARQLNLKSLDKLF